MMNLRHWAAAFALAVLAGCRPGGSTGSAAPEASALVVLDPWVTDVADTATVRVIDRAFPGVRHEPGARFDRVFEGALASSGTVLIPRARDLPWEIWTPLRQFIEQGGCVIFWDPEPFSSGYRATAGGIRKVTDASHEWMDRPPRWPFPDLDVRPFPITGLLERIDISGDVQRAGKIRTTALRLPVEGCGGLGEIVRRIPVARVGTADGAGMGMTAFMEGRILDDGRLCRLGWLGIQPGDVADDDLAAVLRDVVTRLRDDHWLIGAGPAKASVRPGEPLEISYVYRPAGQHASEPVRLEIDLLDPRGDVLRRVRTTPVSGGRQTVALGPVPADRGVGWRLSLRLRVVDMRTTDIREEVRRSILILPDSSVSAIRPPTTMGIRSFFVVAGRPILPLIVAADDPRASPRLLDPATYPVGEIGDRLDRWRQIGLNTVAVTLDRPEQVPQLRHLLAETTDRRMYVMLHLPIFTRPATDWPASRRLVDQLAQLDTHNLLAIDVSAPSTSTGLTHDVARAWLNEVRAPADDNLLADPGIAERCATDLADRHRVAIRQLLRQAGLAHMICDAGLFDQETSCLHAATAAVDFTTLRVNASALQQTPERVAFQIAWTRGLSAHPVLIMGAAPAPHALAPAAALARQATDGSDLMKLALTAHVAGVYFPVAEDGSDPWILPDGRWRPAAYTLREVPQELRGWPPPPPTSKRLCDFRDVLLSESGETYSAFCAAFERGEWLELRPAVRAGDTGFPKPTPLSARSPGVWNELSAFWSDVDVNGKPVWRAPGEPLRVSPRDRVRLAVCSAGAWSWIPYVDAQEDEDRVQIEIAPPAGPPIRLRINGLSAGACGYVDWIPADSGSHTLRIMTPKTGPWGEVLHVTVGDGKP